MSDRDLFLAIEHVEVRKLRARAGEEAPEPGARLYCTTSGESWGLQVRGFLQNADGRQSQTFVYTHARLDVAALRALHEHAGALVAELPAPPKTREPKNVGEALAYLRSVARDPGYSHQMREAVRLVTDHIDQLDKVAGAVAIDLSETAARIQALRAGEDDQ